jgi:hypothetical protein
VGAGRLTDWGWVAGGASTRPPAVEELSLIPAAVTAAPFAAASTGDPPATKVGSDELPLPATATGWPLFAGPVKTVSEIVVEPPEAAVASVTMRGAVTTGVVTVIDARPALTLGGGASSTVPGSMVATADSVITEADGTEVIPGVWSGVVSEEAFGL